MKNPTKKLKLLKKSNIVTIEFGEWFDHTHGNTYYDAYVTIEHYDKNNDYLMSESHPIAYQYGYNAGDKQSIDEALAAIGYRVRVNKKDRSAPYRRIHTNIVKKLKRELYK